MCGVAAWKTPIGGPTMKIEIKYCTE